MHENVRGINMTSLSSIKYSDNNYQQPHISASTRRKLESLGIDPALVTSESQALSMIAARQSEKSFEQYAVYKTDNNTDTQNQTNTSESDLIAEAKSLAEQLGVSIDNDFTFEEITAEISQAISDLINKSANDPIALQRAQQYQVQLSQLTDEFNSVSSSTTDLYSAMNFQANNTRFMLGL